MSKAFVKDDGGEEDGPLDAEEAGESASRARGSSYITAEGFRALQDELEHLWKVERPKVTNEVAVAAAQGDRSENAEYIYGKKRLREIDRRIRFLTKRIDALTIVTHDKQQEGRVYFGAWVTIEDDEGEVATYRLVGSDEIDLARNVISVESPLARALLGKRVSDVVTVQRPKGPADYTIKKIAYRAP